MVLCKKKNNSLTNSEKNHIEFGDAWVWLAFDPVSKLIIHAVIGKRKENEAKELIAELLKKTNGTLPLFTSDELPHYKTVLAEAHTTLIPIKKTGKRGRPKKPESQIDPNLLYATVHKTRENGRVVKVERRIVFGNEQKIDEILKQSTVSKAVNTSYVERVNLNLRQHSRRLIRKTNGFSKVTRNLKAQILLVMAYYNFVLPHRSLKIKDEPERTPAMVANITDHKWSMSELLTYKVINN